uniref:Methyltransferase n=1 Tax=Heterorhabditis bacteriophora TaxID=37862 RepID=A0A1I7XKF6_HETBA
MKLDNELKKRTIDCISSGKKDDCILIAPNADPPRDPKKYKCRREPMPQTEWNLLARNSTTRLACAIGCEPDFDLSVITKVPYDNDKCQKYYTYDPIMQLNGTMNADYLLGLGIIVTELELNLTLSFFLRLWKGV